MFLVAAVAAALAGAMIYGLSAVLEQRSVSQVAERGVFSPRLLVDLAHRPVWLASIAATIAGAALQATALHFGPLALVQPILACDLLFAVLINAVARRAAPDGVLFVGAVCCAAGLGVFLAVAQPTGGTETVSLPAVIPLAAGLAAVLAGCLAVARAGSRATRALALALACGVCYGVNAFLLKLVTFSLAQGFSEPLQQWPLYVLIIVGPVGFLFNQEAFQIGRLVSPALAVITTTTALVSIGIGYLWLDESFASGPADVVTEVASLIVMTAGIALLAYRAPAVARRRDATATVTANPAEAAHEAGQQGDRVGQQQDARRGDDVEQVMIRGRDHVDRRGSGVEPGCRA
ncbi:MAG: DMT family transporter [Actinobacteria bacterium]|nr:DMT family transporter [Actinomycetota bacterium]